MASRSNVNFQAILQSIFHFVKSQTQKTPPGPCDGLVLKLHYRVAFCFALGGFFTVWYGWYFHKIIHCVGTFNSEKSAREDYENICLSYPFLVEEGNRRYLLFYRWVHWTLLLIAVIFYLPRKLSKNLENPKAKRIIEELATIAPRYDQSEREAVQKVLYYMMVNVKTHNGLYFKYLFLNIFALFLDIFILHFLDFLFHGRYLLFIPNSYPFTRNPQNFSDYISTTFPPFADCVLNEEHKILHGREEVIGCHLTIMELYEKIFFIFWLVLYGLIIATLIHVLVLISMLVSSTWPYFLRPAKPIHTAKSVGSLMNNLSANLRIGDVYFLHRIKSHMNHARFYELLLRLQDPNITPPSGGAPKTTNEEPSKEKMVENTRILDPRISGGDKGSQTLRNRLNNEARSSLQSPRLYPAANQQPIQTNQLYHTLSNPPRNHTLPNQQNYTLSANPQKPPTAAVSRTLQIKSDQPDCKASAVPYHTLLANRGLKDTSVLIESD